MSDAEPTNDQADVREAIDQSRSGAPAAGWAVRDRFSADEIFQRVVASADDEIAARTRELLFSGLAAGFAITLTFLAHAAASALFPENDFFAAVLYPIGFVYIVMGRYQLYTENTLPPVTLVLTRLASLPLLGRIWTLVLVGNVVGAALGVFVLTHTAVLSPEAAQAATEIGREGIETSWWTLFFKAIFAGWIVAGVVWLDHAARDSVTRFLLIYLAFFSISALGLYHVVVTAADAMYLIFTGGAAIGPSVIDFWLPVLFGNTIGGVVLVALVNYAQTGERRVPYPGEGATPLSAREWLLGGRAGRSHVPIAKETSETERSQLSGSDDRPTRERSGS
jgi:formate-nitrite transporter family protein